MNAVFLRKPGLSSWLIRLACWSQWSHVAIQADAVSVIHATFWGRGVHRTLIEDLMLEYTAAEWVEIPVPDEKAAADFVREQIGRPYDWTALLGFILRRDWSEPDRWFCSELLEAALVAGGKRRFRLAASRITQQHQWMLEP